MILKIMIIAVTAIAVASTACLTILMNRYEKSAVRVTKEENGIEVSTITKDPKLKRASLIAKAVTLISFITIFILFALYVISIT